MQIRSLVLLGALAFSGPAGAATLWAGADALTSGFGVHAGKSLLRVPFIGTLGVEGNLEKGWSDKPNRYAAGVTVRDLNLPFTKVDAFGTLGAEYRGGTHLYAETGLRGPLLGPAGWRAFVRANSARQFGAGVGLELRF
ncbi:hypothetical protein [Deinococcus sp.]|uniref:hypothetical protein n=1 Tax=Deinococcus sp. TaxID=47478 RepID=UPI0025BD0AAE|nr:hypothetical protein [Deinococcus sp.]